MSCLFIDSGFEPGVVALFCGNEVQRVLKMPSKDPSFPFTCLDSILLDGLKAIAVGVGPGSYTGIRTSVSVAQALSYAKNIPLISVPTLLRGVPEEDGSYIVALDARQGGAFCLSVDVSKKRILKDFSIEKLSLEALERTIAEKGSLLVADDRLRERLPHVPSCQMVDSFLHIAQFCQDAPYFLGKSPELLYLS